MSIVGKRIGNYVISGLIGEGGMGAVYQAEHPEIGRKVAVKILDSRLSEDANICKRFLAEARAITRIDHVNIIDIYDFGRTIDGQLYYVMELLKGVELANIMEQRGKMMPQEVRPYVEQICEGLQAAHENGVVHRDLKPENIFIVDAKKLVIKLIDFGIAKVQDPDFKGPTLTAKGVVMGTPMTISPEQAAGYHDRVGPRTDLYSLGVVLYWMMGGQPPFVDPAPAVVLAKHITDEPPSLRTRNQGVPVELALLVHRCLAKQPAERPSSAAEILTEFNSVVRRLSQPFAVPSGEELVAQYARPQEPQQVGGREHPTAQGIGGGPPSIATAETLPPPQEVVIPPARAMLPPPTGAKPASEPQPQPQKEPEEAVSDLLGAMAGGGVVAADEEDGLEELAPPPDLAPLPVSAGESWNPEAEAPSADEPWNPEAEPESWNPEAEAPSADEPWNSEAEPESWNPEAEAASADASWNPEAEAASADASWNPEAEAASADASWNPEAEAASADASWNPEAEAASTDASWNPEVEAASADASWNPEAEASPAPSLPSDMPPIPEAAFPSQEPPPARMPAEPVESEPIFPPPEPEPDQLVEDEDPWAPIEDPRPDLPLEMPEEAEPVFSAEAHEEELPPGPVIMPEEEVPLPPLPPSTSKRMFQRVPLVAAAGAVLVAVVALLIMMFALSSDPDDKGGKAEAPKAGPPVELTVLPGPTLEQRRVEVAKSLGVAPDSPASSLAHRAGDNPQARLVVGELLLAGGRPKEAGAHFNAVLEKDSANMHARFRLGEALQEEGRYNAAMEQFQTVLKSGSLTAHAHTRIGQVYGLQKQTTKELFGYKDALQVDPSYVPARIALGYAYGRLRRYEEAIEQLDRAAELDPDNAMTFYYRGTVVFNLGRIEDAIQSYQRALQLKPKYVQAHYYLGQAYVQQGDKDKARAAFKAALKIQPDFEPAILALNKL